VSYSGRSYYLATLQNSVSCFVLRRYTRSPSKSTVEIASRSTNAVIPLRNLTSTASPQIPKSSANSPVSHNGTAVRLPAGQQPLSVSANPQSNSWERCYKVAQVLCAAVLAIMGVLAAYWTLMVSWWTAEKDFREDCRSQNTSLGYMSTDCTFELSKPLQSPPVPVDFHARRSQPFTESQWHTVVLVVPWRQFYIHYSVSYDETHRPGFETMIPAIVTIVCVLCPVFYLCCRRYLRQRCRRNPVNITPGWVLRYADVAQESFDMDREQHRPNRNVARSAPVLYE
jgi:hypothetical protein